jgi:hypothetical protein
MKHAYEILISMHHDGDLSVNTMLRELQQFSTQLLGLSESLSEWFLGGATKQEALLYKMYKNDAQNTEIKALLEVQLNGKNDPRCIAIWNGKEGHEGASIQLIGRPKDKISLVSFVGRPKSFSSNWQAIAEVMKTGTVIWHPNYITVESNGYSDHKVFKDRPGVGWMLYLPQILNDQQIPEARALVPVMGTGDEGKEKQIGTIIVSVTDAPFSDENPEHVKIANAIEIRLVDQDLLPRFIDL